MSMEKDLNGGSLSRIRCGNFERRDESMRGRKRDLSTRWFKKFKTSLVVSGQKSKCLLTRKLTEFLLKGLHFSLETCTIFRQMIQYE